MDRHGEEEQVESRIGGRELGVEEGMKEDTVKDAVRKEKKQDWGNKMVNILELIVFIGHCV